MFRYAVVITFLITLAAPAMGMFFGIEEPDVVFERREKVEFPAYDGQVSLTDYLDAFPNQFEQWFNGSFSFKEQLVKLSTFIDFKLGHTFSEFQGIIGRDGWVFLGNRNGVMFKHCNWNLYSPKHEQRMLTAKIKQLSSYERYFNKRGVPFYVVVTPDKYSIYPEQLPWWCPPSRDETVIDRTINAIRANFPRSVSLRGPLLQAKGQDDDFLYYRTDSHWNFIGAYRGYQQIINLIRPDFPDIIPARVEKFDVRLGRERRPGHDLAHVLAIKEYLLDEVVDMHFDDPEPRLTFTSFTSRDFDALEPSSEPIDPDTEILNAQLGLVHNQVSLNNLKLLLLRDSFSCALSPYLNRTFSDVVHIHWSRFDLKKAKSIIRIMKPDLVIYQTVERWLPK